MWWATFAQENTFVQKNAFLTVLSLHVRKFTKFLISFLKSELILHGTTTFNFFSSNITFFLQKYPIKVEIFRHFTAVKIHQIPNVIFHRKVQFIFKVWIFFNVMRHMLKLCMLLTKEARLKANFQTNHRSYGDSPNSSFHF